MGGEKEERWEQRMADAFRQLDTFLEGHGHQSLEQSEPCTEKQLFALLTRVYLNEEEIRVRQKLKRKSSQRISRVIHEKVGVFLSQRLPDYEFYAMEGLLFAKKDKEIVAVLKCIPDLGSYDTHSECDDRTICEAIPKTVSAGS